MATIFQEFPRDDFKALVQSLVGIHPVIWAGEKEPFTGPKNGRPGSVLKLDVMGVQKLGVEDVIQTWVPSANGGQGANQIEVGGQRVYTIEFRVNSFDFNIPGYDPLEDLRIKFRFASTLATLKSLGLSFIDAGDVVPVNVIADNREEFSAVCEMQFGFAPKQTVTDDSGGIIEQVNGGGWIPFTPID